MALILKLLLAIAAAAQAATTPAYVITSAGEVAFGAEETRSTFTTTGRYSQTLEDCMVGTPDFVGQLCFQDSATDTMFVASDTVLGAFVAVETSAEISFGHIHISSDTEAETTLSGNTVFVKAAGTCGAGDLEGFSHSTNCRLTYIGTITKKFVINISISISKASGGPTTGFFRVAKNGNPNTDNAFFMQTIRTLANTSDIGAGSLHRAVELATNDYVELWVATSNADNVTIEAMSFIVTEK